MMFWRDAEEELKVVIKKKRATKLAWYGDAKFKDWIIEKSIKDEPPDD